MHNEINEILTGVHILSPNLIIRRIILWFQFLSLDNVSSFDSHTLQELIRAGAKR